MKTHRWSCKTLSVVLQVERVAFRSLLKVDLLHSGTDALVIEANE